MLKIVVQNNSLNTKDKLKIIFRFLKEYKLQNFLKNEFNKMDLSFILYQNPRFFYKIILPYVCINLSTKDKLDFLLSNYYFMKQKLGIEFIKLYFNKGIKLYDFENLQIDMFLELSYMESSEKEGEWMFHLKNKNSRIYSIIANIKENNLYISGLQGHNDIELIKSLTKKSFGMRPHNLLFYAVLEFFNNFNIDKIYGIKTKSHIYNELNKKDRLKFDYDKFFIDIYEDKISENEYWYIMPNRYPLKSIEEIKSKKRSMYKKRYKMLDELKITLRSFNVK